ncbi:hypothetical protein ACNRBH_09140 [Ralstonia pseudosolanacearum]|uniref:hypothetical protein n=1 Tax=Ralstonia pseudosolanacearum TaxID=1310165 RepID=UPI0026751F58|nr:hypothetical protein [Ralstonia pseudosolanacearum]MDO3527525.1 hypothetical protein [Ralstonia pseudosolanacearum]MDO3531604.1 hypothetical protein [Ralstonia pseudosolanacearum]
MPRDAHPDREAALAAIREHTERLGRIEGQRHARKLFPSVELPTWQGWCRLVRLREKEPEAAPPLATLPAPSAPAVVPVASGEPLSFDARLGLLDAVAIAMLDAAWPTDAETGRRSTRVKNPMLAKAAAAILRDSSALWARHHEAERNAERFRERSEELGRVLGEALRTIGDGEATRGIIAALKAMDESWRERDGIGLNVTPMEVA